MLISQKKSRQNKTELRKAAIEDGFSDPKGLVKAAREKLLGYVWRCLEFKPVFQQNR